MTKSLLFICLGIIIPFLCSAQHIDGVVLDALGHKVEQVYVVNKNLNIHSHTDQNGHFEINASAGDTLQFVHIGYKLSTYQVQEENESVTIKLDAAIVSLEEVYISPKIDALNLLSDIDVSINPVNSSQELLRKMPGVVIGQHAGGGKAEQIFIRGFDADHGTDINISVDGMPVNMVSHAHGQGYADLHFMIPETIERLDFGKGPYYANQGNFTTAGYVEFQTKDRLESSLVKLEAGQFNSQRIVGVYDILNSEDHAVYLATEYQLSDGPFKSPQNFSRLNVMTKYSGALPGRANLSLSLSHFTSDWDASGQIPQRAIDNGSLGRFGSIDDTEGGNTSRSNVILEYRKSLSNHTTIKNSFYFSHYDFELYSNFTFYLNDPENGDQILQQENRNIFGIRSQLSQSYSFMGLDVETDLAIGMRSDVSQNNELSHTVNRQTTLNTIQLGNIDERNFYGYASSNLYYHNWTFNAGLRLDYFDFQYYDKLAINYDNQSASAAIISPKLNVTYNPSTRAQFYLKTGKGFHSNDTRVVVAQNAKKTLPSAWGTDFGVIWKPIPQLFVNGALWGLYMEQEFVYVGDEGVVEPGGETRRMGVDLSARFQPADWVYMNLDANYTLARSISEPEGGDYIPLAPDFTLMSSLSFLHPSGVFGGFRFRYVDNRPANEDNSIVAQGYGVVDMNLGYQINRVELALNIQNLFNTKWNETQFATESRLRDEPAAVEEIHFTPGTPFFVKGGITYKF